MYDKFCRSGVGAGILGYTSLSGGGAGIPGNTLSLPFSFLNLQLALGDAQLKEFHERIMDEAAATARKANIVSLAVSVYVCVTQLIAFVV